MYTKIILVTLALGAATAQHHDSHGRAHGHAHSSQSFVLHQRHEHAPAHNAYYGANHGHQIAQLHGHEAIIGHNQGGFAGHGHHAEIYHANSGHQQGIYHGHSEHVNEHVEYHAHPRYEFAYEVHDAHTHDIKQQHEARDGDHVTGSYSLHQPDGRVRVVHYNADHTGFNADVQYEGHAQHAVPQHRPYHN